MQTSLSGALGYINLGCLYGMFAGFSIVGPAVVGKIGPKYVMFFLSNLEPL